MSITASSTTASTITASELARAMSTAEHWAAHDPDPQTKAETLSIINLVTLGEEQGETAVVAQFGSRLAFGTAGLRAEVGAGPARMNKMVVMQTSAALAQWLKDRDASTQTVVVGFDARTKSDIFARAAAEVFAGAGLRTILLPGPLPTPITAFAVRHYGAVAGVMITASHNPPKDNGYKVFLGGADEGSQIAPPVDTEVSAIIDEVASASLNEIALSSDFEFGADNIFSAYTDALASSIDPKLIQSLAEVTDFKIVYTALHGVGANLTEQAFANLGLPKLITVDEQNTPDPGFPTVAFPNPEEEGALDLAFKLARTENANLIIAHDPDADRLAIALPDADSETGYRRLTGNQLGLLLGWQAAERHAEGDHAESKQATLACTIVSSPALREVAAAYGLDYRETLSGFKWVSRVPGLIFGFEEALGYLTRPNLVRDKDGISASVDLVMLALQLHKEGKTIWDQLAAAAEKFGAFASSQITIRRQSVAEVRELAAAIRRDPPSKFGDTPVTEVIDLLLPGVAEVQADVLRFNLADGARVMVRPSGTEPKLKIYLDTFSTDGNARQRQNSAEAALKELHSACSIALNLE